MINDVLRDVAQQISQRKQSKIPGLIIAKLRDIEKHGLPQIPPGVDQNLMASLRVDHDCGLMKVMMEVSFICC